MCQRGRESIEKDVAAMSPLSKKMKTEKILGFIYLAFLVFATAYTLSDRGVQSENFESSVYRDTPYTVTINGTEY